MKRLFNNNYENVINLFLLRQIIVLSTLENFLSKLFKVITMTRIRNYLTIFRKSFETFNIDINFNIVLM